MTEAKILFELSEADVQDVIHALNLRGLDLWDNEELENPSLGQTSQNLQRLADELQMQSGIWGDKPPLSEYRAAVDALREAAEKARGTLAESMYDTGAIARGACQLAHRQLAEALDAFARLESGEGE